MRLIVFVGALLCAALVSGQTKDYDKPSILTLTGGWSSATLVRGEEEASARQSFFLGIRKDLKFIPFMDVEWGLLYVQKGATFSDRGSNRRFRLDYIDVPLAFKPKLGPAFGIFGVSGNFNVYSKIDDQNLDQVTFFEVTSQLGLGLKYRLFTIDMRWNRGLSDIASGLPGDAIYNSYFLLGIGLAFQKN